MGNGIPEGNKGMAPETEHIAGHSVSLHVLEKMVGNSFGKAGSKRKLEYPVKAGGLYSNGEVFQVLT